VESSETYSSLLSCRNVVCGRKREGSDVWEAVELRLCIRIFRVADGGVVKLMLSGCIRSVKLSYLNMESSRGGCKVIYIIFKT